MLKEINKVRLLQMFKGKTSFINENSFYTYTLMIQYFWKKSSCILGTILVLIFHIFLYSLYLSYDNFQEINLISNL